MYKIIILTVLMTWNIFAGVKADSWFEENEYSKSEIRAYNDAELEKQNTQAYNPKLPLEEQKCSNFSFVTTSKEILGKELIKQLYQLTTKRAVPMKTAKMAYSVDEANFTFIRKNGISAQASKLFCATTVLFPNKQTMNIEYTIQFTEDGNSYFVEVKGRSLPILY